VTAFVESSAYGRAKIEKSEAALVHATTEKERLTFFMGSEAVGFANQIWSQLLRRL
jgi:hypothetical protein